MLDRKGETPLPPRGAILGNVLVIYAIGLAALLAPLGCDADNNGGITGPQAVSLAIDPEVVLLTAINAEVTLDATLHYADGSSVTVSPTYTIGNPALATLSAPDRIRALAFGQTDLTATLAAHPGISATVPVIIGADVYTTHGYGSPTQPFTVRALSSTTLQSWDTGPSFIADEGAPDIERFDSRIWVLLSDSGTNDRIRVYDANTLVFITEIDLGRIGNGQSIFFASRRKGYVPQQKAKGNGDYTIATFDPQTYAVGPEIVVPNPTGGEIAVSEIAGVGNRLLVTNYAWKFQTGGFPQGTVVIVDWETDTVIDADPTTPQVDHLPVGALTGSVNPRRCAVAPDGTVLVSLSGDGWVFTPGAVQVLDPLSYATLAEVTLGADAYAGGQVAFDADGRAYLPSQYDNVIYSFDTRTRTVLRGSGNGIAPVGLSGPGIIGAARLMDARMCFAAAFGAEFILFNPADDTDVGPVPLTRAPTPNPLGVLTARDPDVILPPVMAGSVVSAMNLVAPADDAARALGHPRGAGAVGPAPGASELVAIGAGGDLVLRLDRRIVDRPGPDLVVFGAAVNTAVGRPVDFDANWWRDYTGGVPGLGAASPGTVAVSDDGVTWHAFPTATDASFATADPRHWASGFCGVSPTLANDTTMAGDIPLERWTAGGDRFDLATLGLSSARYVRLAATAAAALVIDAVAAIHHAP